MRDERDMVLGCGWHDMVLSCGCWVRRWRDRDERQGREMRDRGERVRDERQNRGERVRLNIIIFLQYLLQCNSMFRIAL